MIDLVNYDSDDSDDSNENPSSSNSDVNTDYILGFEDGPIRSKSDQEDFTISRVGGVPIFLNFQNLKIPITDFDCKSCQDRMGLITQIYCISSQRDSFDRILYLFGCLNQKCQSDSRVGSPKCLRAFRSLKLNPDYANTDTEPKEAQSTPSELLEDNPFKKTESSNFSKAFDEFDSFKITESIENPFSNLSLQTSTETQTTAIEIHNQTIRDTIPLVLINSIYLTTSYEQKPKTEQSKINLDLQSNQFDQHFKHSKKNQLSKSNIDNDSFDQINNNNHHHHQWKNEKFEVQTIKGIDPQFLKFQERLNWSNQSTQLIRYKMDGKPLVVKSDKLTNSTLKCGHPTRFELQIMPAIMGLIKSIDWTTVWINTCTEDCLTSNNESWSEEQVMIQWAE